MLSASEVANRWRMTPAAVRRYIDRGDLRGVRVGRCYRVAWDDVLACEIGSGSADDPRERADLLTIADLARAIGVSSRTIHRWITAGLPVRRIGTNVRINPFDATDWIGDRQGWRPDLRSSGGRL